MKGIHSSGDFGFSSLESYLMGAEETSSITPTVDPSTIQAAADAQAKRTQMIWIAGAAALILFFLLKRKKK